MEKTTIVGFLSFIVITLVIFLIWNCYKSRMRKRLNNIAKKAIEKQKQEYWDKQDPNRTISEQEEEILRRIMNRNMENRRKLFDKQNKNPNPNDN